MPLSIRRLFFVFSFNSCLFLMLLIGIQNSSNKSKINFVINETSELPLSFIIGTSFISGSILGGLVNLDFLKKNI